MVLDIGANIGHWSGRLSKMVGPQGKVIAFEPVPITYERFKKIYKNLKNINIYDLALSDKDNFVEFLVPQHSFALTTSYISSTNPLINTNKIGFTSIKLPTYCLDSIYKELDINFCSFIKCDVEGHELEVMQGAISFLSRFKPVIYIEILREKWVEGDPRKSGVSSFLEKLGYSSFQIHEGAASEIFKPEIENFLFLYKCKITN